LSRSPSTFRQADVERAIRAAKAAGMEVGRVEVFPNGRIAVYAGTAPAGDDLDDEVEAFRKTNTWYKSISKA
jgi:hypothetical protein